MVGNTMKTKLAHKLNLIWDRANWMKWEEIDQNMICVAVIVVVESKISYHSLPPASLLLIFTHWKFVYINCHSSIKKRKLHWIKSKLQILIFSYLEMDHLTDPRVYLVKHIAFRLWIFFWHQKYTYTCMNDSCLICVCVYFRIQHILFLNRSYILQVCTCQWQHFVCQQ